MKARTFAPSGGENRWRRKEIDEMIGRPCGPVLGKGMQEVKSREHIARTGAGEDINEEPQIRGTTEKDKH